MINNNSYSEFVKSVFLLSGEIVIQDGDADIIFYETKIDLRPDVLNLEGLRNLLTQRVVTDLNGILSLNYKDLCNLKNAKSYNFTAEARPHIIKRYTAIIYPSDKANKLYFTMREAENTEDIITFRLKKSSVNFNINDIVYVGYGNHCVEIHKKDECINMFSIFFSDAADVFLRHKNFVRSYKNCLVNMDMVKCIDKDLFVMTSGEVISIPKRRLKEITKIYEEYVILKALK